MDNNENKLNSNPENADMHNNDISDETPKALQPIDGENSLTPVLGAEEQGTDNSEPTAGVKAEKNKNTGLIALVSVIGILAIALILVIVFANKSPLGKEPKNPKERLEWMWNNSKAIKKEHAQNLKKEYEFDFIDNYNAHSPNYKEYEIRVMPDSDDYYSSFIDNLSIGAGIYSNYSEKNAYAEISIGISNIELLKLNATVDDDLLLISLPEFLEDVYALDMANIGKELSSGLLGEVMKSMYIKIDPSLTLDLFPDEKAASKEEINTDFFAEFYDAISVEVEEETVTKNINGVDIECEKFVMAVPVENIQIFIDDFFEYLEELKQQEPMTALYFNMMWEEMFYYYDSPEELKDELKETFIEDFEILFYTADNYVVKAELDVTEEKFDTIDGYYFSIEFGNEKGYVNETTFIISDKYWEEEYRVSLKKDMSDTSGVYTFNVDIDFLDLADPEYTGLLMLEMEYDSNKQYDNIIFNFSYEDYWDYFNGEFVGSLDVNKTENYWELNLYDIAIDDGWNVTTMEFRYKSEYGKKHDIASSANAKMISELTEDDLEEIQDELTKGIMRKAMSWDF